MKTFTKNIRLALCATTLLVSGQQAWAISTASASITNFKVETFNPNGAAPVFSWLPGRGPTDPYSSYSYTVLLPADGANFTSDSRYSNFAQATNAQGNAQVISNGLNFNTLAEVSLAAPPTYPSSRSFAKSDAYIGGYFSVSGPGYVILSADLNVLASLDDRPLFQEAYANAKFSGGMSPDYGIPYTTSTLDPSLAIYLSGLSNTTTANKSETLRIGFYFDGTTPLQAGVSLRAEAYTSTVPVPGAVWLFSSGLIGLLSARRRQQNFAATL